MVVTALVRVLCVITCVTMVVLERVVLIALETVVARVLMVVGVALADVEDATVTVLAVVLVPPIQEKKLLWNYIQSNNRLFHICKNLLTRQLFQV